MMFSWLSFNCANYICLNDWCHGLWVRHPRSFCSEVVYCPRFCKMNYVQVLFIAPFLFKLLFNCLNCTKASHVPSHVWLHAVRRSYFHMLCRLFITCCASEMQLRNISILALLRPRTWYSWCLLSIQAFCYKREGSEWLH